MKHALILAALLSSGSAMAQSSLTGDISAMEEGGKWYAEHRAQARWEMAHPASTSTCQRNGGPEYPCYICQRGPWYDIKEYECSAREEARQDRARAKR